ncbi:NAD(P)-dependent oxidoreductase [Persephonella sp.]
MKIVFTSVREDEKEFYLKNINCCDVVEFDQPIDRIEIKKIKDADVLSVFVFDRLDKTVLSEFEKLRLIITRSTGVDHIDLDFCREKGIKVAHIPAYSPRSIAEHTFGLILTLTRKLKKIEEREKRLDFSIKPEIMGKDLYTLSLGVIGTGKIGTYVARLGLAFGMNVMAYDIKENPQLKDAGVKYTSLDELVKNSDIISVHVPLLPQTYHLINRERISMMKNGAVLINTSRGQVVDTDAVFDAVVSGKIGALGLDVFEDEALLMLERYREGRSSDKVLKILKLNSMDNVVITPHIAFFTETATENIKNQTVDCINRFTAGQDISDCLVV